MIEESSAQRKMIDQYNSRKVDRAITGYMMTLERGNRKKMIAMAI